MKQFIQLLLILLLLAPKGAHTLSEKVVTLTRFNTLIFNQDIDALSVINFASTLVGRRMMLPMDQTLYVVIVSGGGRYKAAQEFRNILKEMPNTQVLCKYCASAAGFVFADAGIKRLVIKKSELMMHEMYIPHITAREIVQKSISDDLIHESNEFNKVMYDYIGITKDAYEKKIANTEWTVRGADLVKMHLADRLVEVACDEIMNRLAPDTCSK